MVEKNRIDAAAFDRMTEAASNDAQALAALAEVALWSGNEEGAYALARRALALAPDDPEVRSRARHPLTARVPRWHFRMLRDERRNRAFDDALRRAVRPGMRVLDIGSGSGLLAMMAARAGAASVASCEMNEAVADVAREIVALNGLDAAVRVIGRKSTELDPEEIGGPADLIVAEIVSNDLLGEGVLPVMEDAVRRLLKPGGAIVPAAGAAMVALARWTGLEEALSDVSGFDLSPFSTLAGIPHRLEVDDRRLSLSSEAAALFEFPFASGGPWRGGRATVALTATAPANGIVQWIRLRMDEDGVYENRPGHEAASCWAALFTPFDPAREAQPGEIVQVHGSYEPTRLRIRA
ncbi:MAG TPA: 50S ribosomal protein L11 methyltransferase [Allosphingosinicella sp.]|nr:50S ribosomal protein L11 methyltransferase [Allosphingosinicella sp.]HYG29146.1 50S ribosomal protein L11 methyltransferase [Allosphingosinicella sp.]